MNSHLVVKEMSINPISTLEFLRVALFSILTLCLVGYSSIRFMEFIFRKKLMHFADQLFGLSSDYVVKLNFFLYTGISFLLLYIEIFSILRVFNIVTFYCLIILSLIVLLLDIARFLKTKAGLFPNSFAKYVPLIAITVSLGLTFLLRSMIIVGEFGSTGGDGAFHSSIISRIIKNNALPSLTFVPEGSHSVAAFLTIILNIPIYKTVILLVSVFSVTVFFGFYCLGVNHTSKSVYGYLCAIIGSLFWTLSYFAIHFAGLTFMLGMYILISVMAFSTKLITSKPKLRFQHIFFAVLLFIPLFAVHPIALLFEMFWLLLLITKFLILHRKFRTCIEIIVSLILSLTIAALLSAIFLKGPILFGLTNLQRYGLEGSSVFQYSFNPAIELNRRFSPWIFLQPADFGSYLTLYGGSFEMVPYGVLATISSIPLILLLKRKIKQTSCNFNFFCQISGSILLYYTFMIIIHYFIRYEYLYYLLFLFPADRVWQTVGVILAIMETLTLIMFWILLDGTIHLLSKKIVPKHVHARSAMMTRKQKNAIHTLLLAVVLSTLFLSSVNLFSPLDNTIAEHEYLKGHSVITIDDIVLQLWMKEHLPDSSRILISHADAGQYIPAIAEKLNVIYEYGVPISLPPYSYMTEYQKLLKLLASSPDDHTTLELLQFFDITHIYVGAKHTDAFPVGDASTLLSAKHYKVTYHVGDAWVFEYNE